MGLHMIYPCLDMGGSWWVERPTAEKPAPASGAADNAAPSAVCPPDVPSSQSSAVGRTQPPKETPASKPHNSTRSRRSRRTRKTGKKKLTPSGFSACSTVGNGPSSLRVVTAPNLTSRVRYATDGVLPFQYFLKIGESLVVGRPIDRRVVITACCVVMRQLMHTFVVEANRYLIRIFPLWLHLQISLPACPRCDTPLRSCAVLLRLGALSCVVVQCFIHVGAVDPLIDDSVGWMVGLCVSPSLLLAHRGR